MRFLTAFLLVGLSAGIAFAQFDEICRIKILNVPRGSIEVSSDRGKTWETAGRVIYAVNKTKAESYYASRWVADGTIAATAVNAIHIKTAAGTDESGAVFSILPREYLKPPRHYNSYLSPDSSVYTDIPAGEKIFGGSSSPLVGNVVRYSRKSSPAMAIAGGYVPMAGDKFYIVVNRPVNYPKEIIFENRFGGAITINYFNGTEKVIGQVLRPVIGVGRFDGTKYASVGRIRANHAGVIDISTSRLGKIGGFQIVPSVHGSGMRSVREMTQWMVIGPAEVPGVSLEGQAPLFKYFIRPAYGAADLENEKWEQKLLERFLVEVKVRGDDRWRPMPAYEFNDYYLTGDLPGWADAALDSVTHVRILFPIYEK